MAVNSSWTNLQSLNLSYNKIGNEGAAALASNISWNKLQLLHLASNEIASEGAAALAANKFWTNLKDLDLSYNEIGNEGVFALSQNKIWDSQMQLYVPSNIVKIETNALIFDGLIRTKLQWLNSSYNNTDCIDVAAVAQKKVINTASVSNYSALEEINKNVLDYKQETGANLMGSNSYNNKSGYERFMYVHKNTNPQGVKSFNFSNNGLDLKNVSIRASPILCNNLTDLDLSWNWIGPEGAKNLAAFKLPHLKNLNLSFNQICDEGAIYLSENSKQPNLQGLDLKCNQIGYKGAF